MSNSLTVEQLRSQLSALGLDDRGHRSELRNRLRKQQGKQFSKKRGGGTNYNGRGGVGLGAAIGVERADGSSLADTATSWRRVGVKEVPVEKKPVGEQQRARSVVEEWKPSMDSYLVLDVEATCERGKLGQPRRASFEFPNEIIEFPIVLLQWKKIKETGNMELCPTDVFHTFVKPVWRPRLTQFCRDLTGIDQQDIDSAPSFAEAVDRLHAFLASHELLEAGQTRQILSRRAKATPSPSLRKGVCWVTHGPFDLLSFVVKQCYISGLAEGVPSFLRGPLIDVKLSAVEVTLPREKILSNGGDRSANEVEESKQKVASNGYPFRDTTVDGLLALLRLEPFEGRHHSGLDDTRNIARIFANVASRVAQVAVIQSDQEEVDIQARLREASELERATLLPNTQTDKGHLRRWEWMDNEKLGRVVWNDPEET